jgi:protein-S-isoprenylcysteine O-methyltransferase Ste14
VKDLLALIIIMLWPVIPLFWIPVHYATGFFKRLGRLSYLPAALLTVVLAYVIFINREFIVAQRISLPFLLSAVGLLMLAASLLLHIWTARLLTLRGIIGIPEIAAQNESKLVDKGPFSVVRHPTYLAHTMMLIGAFLFTGSLAVGLLTFLDFIIVILVIIPLEEKELLRRFGPKYADYTKKVPRLIPRISINK